jgi:hypothetical protein
MKIRLQLSTDQLERFKDLLYTCVECDNFFIVDQEIAEAVLKQLEEADY